jgi:hypothetical protein
MVAGYGRMGRMAALSLAASLLAVGPDVLVPAEIARRDPPPPDPARQRQRAYERRERKRRDAEFRERLLRQKIAEGKDGREDKYLHAAARRRRAAGSSPALPRTAGA